MSELITMNGSTLIGLLGVPIKVDHSQFGFSFFFLSSETATTTEKFRSKQLVKFRVGFLHLPYSFAGILAEQYFAIQED